MQLFTAMVCVRWSFPPERCSPTEAQTLRHHPAIPVSPHRGGVPMSSPPPCSHLPLSLSSCLLCKGNNASKGENLFDPLPTDIWAKSLWKLQNEITHKLHINCITLRNNWKRSKTHKMSWSSFQQPKHSTKTLRDIPTPISTPFLEGNLQCCH